MNKILCFGSLNIDYTYRVPHFVNAGDTFAGYFLQSIASGKDVKEALKTAAKAAAICVTRHGASISIPDCEELINADFSESRCQII